MTLTSNPDSSRPTLSHLDSAGHAHMVDVSGKDSTVRIAVAASQIKMKPTTLQAILAGNTPKGDVIGTARLAGIMAAKQTATLIPLCHPLPLQSVKVDIVADEEMPGFVIQARVKTKSETGVEMEALTAVSIAALTLYDMAKGLEKSMDIGPTRLLKKEGGKSGHWQAPTESH